MKTGIQGFVYCSHPGKKKKTRQLQTIQLTTTISVQGWIFISVWAPAIV